MRPPGWRDDRSSWQNCCVIGSSTTSRMDIRFVRVRELVPDDQEIFDVPVGTPVADALSLMRAHNVDQLPVRTTHGHVVGVFSYRSLARGLSYVPAQNPLAAPVDDLVEDLTFVASSERLERVLAPLAADNAILVGDEERLLAVVTAADLNAFLWRRTQPFLLLRDIELGVRDLMSSCCAGDDLAATITAALPADAGVAEPSLENLTWSQLTTVLLHDDSFGRFFRHRFGRNRGIVKVTLEPVREIRNKVFHFRGDILPEEMQSLTEAMNWVRRRAIMSGGGR